MTPQLRTLLTIVRDNKTKRNDFIFYADRINRLLIEEGLNFLPTREKIIETRTGSEYKGSEFVGKICAVPIIRAGLSMENSIREVAKKIRIGHILIQRNEETAEPMFFKEWLPGDIDTRFVFILDPMLATGGSAIETIRVLKERGVQESKIIFINLVAAPEGIEAVLSAYPGIRIITAEIDGGLNAQAYILPGLGDFGDIYFGTD
ncbi:uracil phosphoribosyltransferase [candidate division KSB3 bacterium]|uniref:uracil phosphoribosyltransferase n=1 Tax=candidate division KSB3 bacterium TaxID=2044937 RepID=A0A9D5Q539_9BACT|nr:uracil phosphoribosyltransferase [candidate division KSB3 bacterium]MBD3323923.1 uracil phosphoribosyltransferase [candidate division KSB3 bacterium]